MKDKIYKKFKAKEVVIERHYQPEYEATYHAVVTDDPDGLIVALIPRHLKNQSAIAKALAKAMTDSKLALTDLI